MGRMGGGGGGEGWREGEEVVGSGERGGVGEGGERGGGGESGDDGEGEVGDVEV